MSWYESCLKPVIEVATFMGVIGALFYQESIIKSQRKEFERQRIKDNKQAFETLYFNLLNTYEVKIQQSGITYNCPDGLKFYQNYLEKYASTHFKGSQDLFTILQESIDSFESPEKYIEWVKRKDNFMIIDFNLSMTLEILCKLDTVEVYNSIELDKQYKRFYFDLFFKTKDKHELTVYLIWCLFPQYGQLRILIEKYNLFETAVDLHKFKKIKNIYNTN